MDAKQKKAMKQLLGKISTLRATLSAEEQKLLDELIITAPVEVEAHQKAEKMQSKIASRTVSRYDWQITYDEQKQVYRIAT